MLLDLRPLKEPQRPSNSCCKRTSLKTYFLKAMAKTRRISSEFILYIRYDFLINYFYL